MIKIQKCSEVVGANRFGSCLSCGKQTSDGEIYRIMATDEETTQKTTFCLCGGCLLELGMLIGKNTGSKEREKKCDHVDPEAYADFRLMDFLSISHFSDLTVGVYREINEQDLSDANPGLVEEFPIGHMENWEKNEKAVKYGNCIVTGVWAFDGDTMAVTVMV